MITPIIFYNLIIALVGLAQYFLEPFVLTRGQGDPGGSTMFYNLYLYKVFFKFGDMGYGATLAWVLFVIILVITGVVFWSQKYWVYQADE
jgi:multiple sugar transport system permease protein